MSADTFNAFDTFVFHGYFSLCFLIEYVVSIQCRLAFSSMFWADAYFVVAQEISADFPVMCCQISLHYFMVKQTADSTWKCSMLLVNAF